MPRKDYYSILGVPRKASQNEIRQAYRALARRYHPDQNQDDPNATEKFREVVEAYQVLSDNAERVKYDRMGVFYTPDGRPPSPEELSTMFTEGFFDLFRRKNPNASGDHINMDLSISLEQAYFGATIPIDIIRNAQCSKCFGAGAASDQDVKICPECEGTGKGRLPFSKCKRCDGQKTIIVNRCRACGGTGRNEQNEQLKVTLPRGVSSGKVIRLKGKGNDGYGTGQAGDLLLEISFATHPLFQKRGPDLFCDLPISWTIASLGGAVDVPTLEGKSTIRIPPGTQNGKILRLSRRGFPLKSSDRKGDIHYHICVETPTNLSPKQRTLITEMSKNLDDDNHPQLKKFSSQVQNRGKS